MRVPPRRDRSTDGGTRTPAQGAKVPTNAPKTATRRPQLVSLEQYRQVDDRPVATDGDRHRVAGSKVGGAASTEEIVGPVDHRATVDGEDLVASEEG
jgi:hypothetical protein